MPECTKCSDLGVIDRDGKLYECDCAFVRRLSNTLPLYIKQAHYQKEHLQLGLLKHTDKSIYIKSTWQDMKAIVKALFFMYPRKFIRITSDAEIRDVYVGSKSRAARSEDFDGEVYNNLADLVTGPELLIVRLGEIKNKNKAAPGALLESLKYRIDYGRPVWIWTDLECPFNLGSFAYSEPVAEILATGCTSIEVPRIAPDSNYESYFDIETTSSGSSSGSSRPLVDSNGEEDPAAAQTQKKIKKKAKKTYVEPVENNEIELDSSPSNSLSGYGGGVGKSKKFGQR
jgi:hypothetical protein